MSPSPIDHVLLDRRQLGRDLDQERDQAPVDENDAVGRVVHDVLELLGEQPDVQRVEHRADARHREVGLEVLLDVPRERADTVTGLDAEPLQRGREPLDAIPHLAERGPATPVALERDDLAVAVHRHAVPEQHPDRQRVVLHRPEHRFPPGSVHPP